MNPLARFWYWCRGYEPVDPTQYEDGRTPDASVEEVGVGVPLGFDGKTLRRDSDAIYGGGGGYGSQPLPDRPVPDTWVSGTGL
jgi:hypothetical protein